MKKKGISRRDFLRLSAVTAAGAALVACGAKTTGGEEQAAATSAPAAEATAVPVATTAPAAAVVTLDVMSPVSEYEAPYREIWNVFEAENPGIKINLFSINEDTAAAHEAKVAGGWLPAIEYSQELQIHADSDNYQLFTDLSSFDFPWWDRFTFNAKNAWSDLYDLPGPRTLDLYQGYVFTWQWNDELMQKSGLDPQRDVKNWDDLEKWLTEGAEWAAKTDGVDWFYNQAWHNWVFGMNYADMFPLAFVDGQREKQVDCWLGRAKFNDADSPYRHFYEFFVNANEKGWMPPNMWTRQWEGDMEASYIAGKSVMMLHGPWVWDKAMAAGSEFAINGHQAGMPSTPPAEGQSPWVQGALPPAISAGYFMRTGNAEQDYWDQTLTAWAWLWSPEAVPMRAQAEGRLPLYKVDGELDIQGPQYQAVLKEIDTSGGKWADVKWEQSQTGDVLAGPYRKKGSRGVWDWEANGNNEVFANLLQGKITVQDALDIAQKNWEESYDIPDDVKNKS
jgi:ABC-type glycerol-3-phosphate transport system substrate-binding protein